MTHWQLALEAALEMHDPYDALVKVVKTQLEYGRERKDVLDDLQRLRIDGQDEGVDVRETMLLHIMDRVYGFCREGLAL